MGPPPRRRPPWWPEDQPWPPRGRGSGGGPPAFLLRIGCLLVVLVAFATVALTLVVWVTASTFGMVRGGPRGGSLVTLFVIGLVIFVVVRGVRRVVWPLGGLVRAAGQIEAGDYSTRVPEQGPSELRSVARAFNAMTARLRADEERRRSFLADVTHELRTPLAIIRGQAEAISDGVYPADADHLAPIIDAARTLELLTEDLRTLALSDAGSLVLAREHVDPAALAHDVVAAFQAQAEAAGVSLTAENGGDALAVEADPVRLRSVIGNLVSNALRHTPAGGSVRVAVRSSGERVELTVTDTGEGIPADLLPHVFERFVKGRGSTGSGLGLAIARDIVMAHGGTIDIESQRGVRTAVRIDLAAAR